MEEKEQELWLEFGYRKGKTDPKVAEGIVDWGYKFRELFEKRIAASENRESSAGQTENPEIQVAAEQAMEGTATAARDEGRFFG